VYVPQENRLFLASPSGLLALDSKSGGVERYDHIEPPETQLTLHQKYVYYGASVDGDARVMCVNTEAGKLEWSAALGTPRSVCGLAVTNDVVVATTRGDHINHGRVVCLERTSGAERWRFGNQSVTPPAVDRDHVCIGLSIDVDGASIPEHMDDIYCFELESGTIAYRARTDSGTPYPPVLRDGRLVAVTSQDVCVGFTSV